MKKGLILEKDFNDAIGYFSKSYFMTASNFLSYLGCELVA